MDTNTCVICGRELGDVLIEEHHLVPRTFKGKDTVDIHKICHVKIHTVFSERELLQYYHTPDRIRSHPEIEGFIKWLRNKPTDFYSRSKDTINRKSKRRR